MPRTEKILIVPLSQLITHHGDVCQHLNTSLAGSEELYQIDGVFSQTEYFLKKRDPSTDRLYFECVEFFEGDEKTADNALRWQMDVADPKKYETMTIRA